MHRQLASQLGSRTALDSHRQSLCSTPESCCSSPVTSCRDHATSPVSTTTALLRHGAEIACRKSASEENGVFTRAHRCTGHRLSRSCSAPAQRLVATPRGPRMTPALYPVNAARYYNATLHQRYNATLHQTNARHTAPVWRPTCSTERRRRLQSAVPAGPQMPINYTTGAPGG